jgi:hypothetical protein
MISMYKNHHHHHHQLEPHNDDTDIAPLEVRVGDTEPSWPSDSTTGVEFTGNTLCASTATASK